MGKRIMSLLLALVIIVCMFVLSFATVNALDYSDYIFIGEDKIGNGYISHNFAFSRGVLTLKDYSYWGEGNDYGMIYYPNGNLIIWLSGDASFNNTGLDTKGIYVPNGSVSIVSENPSSDKLSVKSKDIGIYAKGDISFLGGEVKIDSSSVGVHSASNINVDSGKVNISSKDVGMNAYDTINIKDGVLTVKSDCIGEHAINSENINISGGAVSALAADNAIAVKASSLNITGGSLSAVSVSPNNSHMCAVWASNFKVLNNMNITAADEYNGILNNYVAANRYSYDRIVISSSGFGGIEFGVQQQHPVISQDNSSGVIKMAYSDIGEIFVTSKPLTDDQLKNGYSTITSLQIGNVFGAKYFSQSTTENGAKVSCNIEDLEQNLDFITVKMKVELLLDGNVVDEQYFGFEIHIEYPPILGDVDNNRQITIQDATYIQRHVAKLEILSEEQLKVADTDKNNGISIKDATYIQLLVAKLISQL